MRFPDLALFLTSHLSQGAPTFGVAMQVVRCGLGSLSWKQQGSGQDVCFGLGTYRGFPTIEELADDGYTHVECFCPRCRVLVIAGNLSRPSAIADAYAYAVLNWTKINNIDIRRWPRLIAFLDRVAARPAVRQALAEEGLERRQPLGAARPGCTERLLVCRLAASRQLAKAYLQRLPSVNRQTAPLPKPRAAVTVPCAMPRPAWPAPCTTPLVACAVP